MAKDVIIVGPPRSGTSLTAGVFARQGYYVGPIESDALREGDDNNPFGYFEADELIARNVDILRRAGFPHHNTWKYDVISPECIERISGLAPSEDDLAFARAHGAHQPWMWKDPRLCFTLPVWARAVDCERTVVVVVRRNEDEIYRSFLRMGWCEPGTAGQERALEIIRLHCVSAERSARAAGMPFMVVEYAEYLSHPQRVAVELGRLCDLPLTATDLNVRNELSHSSLRGRVAARVRRSLDRGALRPLRALRPIIPQSLVTLLLPEKKHQRDGRTAEHAG